MARTAYIVIQPPIAHISRQRGTAGSDDVTLTIFIRLIAPEHHVAAPITYAFAVPIPMDIGTAMTPLTENEREARGDEIDIVVEALRAKFGEDAQRLVIAQIEARDDAAPHITWQAIADRLSTR